MRKLHFFSTLVALSLATTTLWALPTGVVDGKLPGGFTINDEGDMVYFSQGNLQYIGSAATPYWKFAEEQYEYFGTTTNQNSTATNVDRDLFGWGTGNYPNKTTQYSSDYTSFSDWGNNAIINGGTSVGWRTLTTEEWLWILGPRYTTHNPGVNCRCAPYRFVEAIILTDISEGTTGVNNNIRGLIIFPDNFASFPNGVTIANGNMNNYNGSYASSCTSAGWSAMEEMGCVFLPAAGFRNGTEYRNESPYGRYWSSSASDNPSSPYGIGFYHSGLYSQSGYSNYSGFSVRLVVNVPDDQVPGKPKASASSPTVASDLTYSGNSNLLFTSSAGAATGGTVKYRLAPDGEWQTDYRIYAVNAGTYTVQWFVEATTGCYLNSDTTAIEVTIAKKNLYLSGLTITANVLPYDGNQHPLLTKTGSVSNATIYYSTDGTNWSNSIPQASDVGEYHVWYKIEPSNDNYNAVGPIELVANITAPTVYDNADPATVLSDLYTSGNASPLLVKRTIYRNGEYNTICLPFALDATQLAASPLAGFNNLKTIKGASISGTAPDLSIDIFVEDVTEMEAGKPYLISYPSANENIVNPVFTDITVTETSPGSVTADGITFRGMFAQVHIDPYTNERDEDYLFLGANSQLMWPNDDGSSMRGFRAYFIIDRNAIPAQVAPRGTHARFVNAPKQPTAIENTELNTQAQKLLENGQLIILKNGIKYNAQGQVLK